jgi:beta-lactamase regulating signal transducer with metallopeptidase domain
MGTEILGVSDRLFAAGMNGIYQGILITVLVALSFRVFSRTNAATRHAVWLCTLILLVLLVVAHCFFHSPPPALQPGRIAQAAVTPEQEIGAPNVAAVAATANGMPTETGSSGPEHLGYLPAEQEPLAGHKPDSLSSTSTKLPDELPRFSAGSLPPPGAALREGDPTSPSIPIASLAASTAHDQSGWFYAAIRRLANPVSLTLGLESSAARIAGVIFMSVCLVLSALRLLMLLRRLHQIRKLKRQSFPASEAINELFQDLVTRFRTGRNVALKTLPTVPSSFVLGFLHPVILLPTEQMDLSEAEQILRHELAHVRRRDDWANLLQHFILAAFPFHPAVWWISRRLSLEREIACDDYVLQSSAHPHAYALLLANLAARMQRCPPLLAPGASNNKTQLQQRIDMILNTRRNTSPRLAATWLTFMASTAALFAVIAICLAPRIVLAQSEAAPAPANSQGSPIDEPVHATPAVASVAVSFSSEAGATSSSEVALPVPPRTAAIASNPKLKPGRSRAIPGQPAVEPAPPTPVVLTAPALPAAPAPLSVQSAPLMSPRSILLSAAPVPEPRPGRTPRPVRAESADSTLEERLERLEKMVESLLARGYAAPNPYHPKPSPDKVGPMDRKEMAEIEAHARLQAEMARKHEWDVKEIEKIKEHAKHEAARAVSQVKRAADAEKVARAEQKRQTRRGFKEGSQKQLDDLRKQLEMLDRKREELEHQIEELERNEEQLDQQENEDQDNDVQSNTSESNPDSTPNPRQ